MSERREAESLAHRLLNEPNADPDDDLRNLARQYLRSRERISELTDKLAEMYDSTREMIEANRDAILRKHEEAIQRISYCLRTQQPELAYRVIQVLNMFHPMHGESWVGWPEGSQG